MSLNRHKPCELEHKDYGTIDVKSTKLYYNDKWGFGSKRKTCCDYYFCLGFSEDGNDIEILYIIPNSEVYDIATITVYKNPSKGCRYDKFRIDSNVINILNNIFQDIKTGNCPILKFSKDIA